MSRKFKSSLFEDFEILVCAGAVWMILNIENEEPAEDGLWAHLSSTRNNICNTKPSVVKALEALRYIYAIANLEGLQDIVARKINLKCFFEGNAPDINDIVENIIVPDSWIVLKIHAPDNKCIFKIFSSWFKNEKWRLSSGDTNLNELLDLGCFFIWKQKSGSVYRLVKSHADRFCPYAKSVLDNKFLEPAARTKINVELLIDDDLTEALSVNSKETNKKETKRQVTNDPEIEALFERISNPKLPLTLFTVSEEELAKSFKDTHLD